MEVKDLVPIIWSNQRVVTSAQLSELYKTTPYRIRDNFRKAKEYFTEGEHYFKISGEDLRQLKEQVGEMSMAEEWVEKRHSLTSLFNATNSLVLWTLQGAVRHCKMINTVEAWEVFNVLEQNYFNPAPVEVKEEVKDEPKEEPKKRKPRSDKACAYAMKMNNNLVKIGHTSDMDDRISRVENESGWQVTDEHHSPELERTDARRIERTLHRKYAHVKVKGEYFNADFDDVSDQLDREVELIEETICLPAELTDYERGKLLIELIGVTAESPFKEQLARQTANLLFGKEIF